MEEEGELSGCRQIASPADCLIFCGRPLVTSSEANTVRRESDEETELGRDVMSQRRDAHRQGGFAGWEECRRGEDVGSSL
jgi:hypothetical protein